jgi:SOS-response transcriptional repressor LexA
MTIPTILTLREDVAFKFIRDFIEENGYAPTIREIAVAAGLRSTSSVSYILRRLELKGYIHRLWGRQALTIDPGHAGKVLVSREDLIDALKLAGVDHIQDMNGPLTRLMEAAGMW